MLNGKAGGVITRESTLMTEADDIQGCKEAVLGYCTAINEWQRLRSILSRIEGDQFVRPSQREAVKGLTIEAHHQEHAKIFDRYIVSRARSFGSNPGSPTMWGVKGSFFDVDSQTIRSVQFQAPGRAEVVADWGYLSPGGSVMFVMKRTKTGWLIDSLKTARNGGGWEAGLL